MSLIPFALDPFFGDDLLQPFRYSKGSGQLARSVATDVVEVRVRGS